MKDGDSRPTARPSAISATPGSVGVLAENGLITRPPRRRPERRRFAADGATIGDIGHARFRGSPRRKWAHNLSSRRRPERRRFRGRRRDHRRYRPRPVLWESSPKMKNPALRDADQKDGRIRNLLTYLTSRSGAAPSWLPEFVW